MLLCVLDWMWCDSPCILGLRDVIAAWQSETFLQFHWKGQLYLDGIAAADMYRCRGVSFQVHGQCTLSGVAIVVQERCVIQQLHPSQVGLHGTLLPQPDVIQ